MALEFPLKCKINNEIYPTYYHLMGFLKKIKMTTKDYYDTYHKEPNEGICYCGNSIKWKSGGYGIFCSMTCKNKSESHRKAVSNRYKSDDKEIKLEKFRKARGYVNNNVKKSLQTREQTALKLGFNSLFEYDSWKSKKAYENMTNEQKHNMKLKRIESINKSKTVGGKSGYREYQLFDEIVKIQGYEDLVLDYLQTKFTKEELIAGGKNFGYIEYFDENQKSHMYFPDALIPNFVIEVKSTYTFEMHREKVFQKIGGCFQNNKNIILIIPSKTEARNGKLESSKKLIDWAISSQASNHNEPFVLMYDEGSTTILYGVESSDSKCRGSQRNLREHDIVWSVVKTTAVDNDDINGDEINDAS